MVGWQYRVENFSLAFQKGVRRSVLVFMAICVVCFVPAYFLGQFLSSVWFITPFNPWRFDNNTIFTERILNKKDIDVADSQVVDLINGEKALYLTVSNKGNTQIGFSPWVYKLQILGDNNKLLSEKEYQSYLLPQETKFLVASSTDPQAKFLRFVPSDRTQTVGYNVEQDVKPPEIEILSRTITEADKDNVRLSATFKNNSRATIANVNVLYIVRDTRQSVIGIGTYSFKGFVPGSLRELPVTYPKSKDRIPQLLDVRWSVNYLETDELQF
jgi:hypothetical protein